MPHNPTQHNSGSLPGTAPPKVSLPGSGSRQGGRGGRLDESRDRVEARKSTGVNGQYSGTPASLQRPHADSMPKPHRGHQNRWGNASKCKPFGYVPLGMHLVIVMSITIRSDDTETSTGTVRVVQPYEDG